MKDRFQLLVFDWDGTLFDSVEWIVECLQQAADQCGLPVPSEEAARSVIGLGLREAMDALYPGSPEDLAARVAQSYRRHYGAKPITELGLFDGVRDMLVELRQRGYRLAVATGKARAGLNHALTATGMGDFFHATRCADETASKPDPKMLYQIMEEVAVLPEKTLMVGDSLHDLHMARNAGISAVGVGCGAHALHQLTELNPLACLRTTSELLNLLD